MSEKKSNSAISQTEVDTRRASDLNNESEYINVIEEAIKKSDRGTGCSRQIIANYIKSQMKGVNEDSDFHAKLDKALEYGVLMNIFYKNKGAGGSGAYKLSQALVYSEHIGTHSRNMNGNNMLAITLIGLVLVCAIIYVKKFF